MWMDLRVLLLLHLSGTKELDGSPTNAQNKRFIKNEDTGCYSATLQLYVPAVSLSVSLLCFVTKYACLLCL